MDFYQDSIVQNTYCAVTEFYVSYTQITPTGGAPSQNWWWSKIRLASPALSPALPAATVAELSRMRWGMVLTHSTKRLLRVLQLCLAAALPFVVSACATSYGVDLNASTVDPSTALRDASPTATVAEFDTRGPTVLGDLPSPVVGQARTSAALAFVPGPYETLLRNESLSLAVAGRVSKIQYHIDPTSGMVFTSVTLNVSKAWRGTKIYTVTFMELGGFARQSDLARLHGAKAGAVDPPTDGWVDVRFEDSEPARTGQQLLVFLRDNRDPQGRFQYETLNGPWGRYAWDEGLRAYRTVPFTDGPNGKTSFPGIGQSATDAILR